MQSRIRFMIFHALLTSSSIFAAPSAVPAPLVNIGPGWSIVFSDEFDSTALNMTKWNNLYPTYFSSGSEGHYHNYDAYLAEENVYLQDGCLVLKGENKHHPNDTRNFAYTSGVVTTRGKFFDTCGYYEARCKVPPGAMSGKSPFWPAFWMAPQDATWPPEIDIFEYFGDGEVPGHTIHWYTTATANHDALKTFWSPVLSQNTFHIFSLLWKVDRMEFFVDGISRGVVTDPAMITKKAMFILFNLGIDSGYGTNATWPAYMMIDYCRVWRYTGAVATRAAVRRETRKAPEHWLLQKSALPSPIVRVVNSSGACFDLKGCAGAPADTKNRSRPGAK